jgi:hypothetical protein
MARYPYDALVFRGAPLAMCAVQPGEAAAATRGRAARDRATMAMDSGEERELRIERETTAGGQLFRTHITRSTPPGRYEGRVVVNGVEHPAVFEVEPEVFLRIFPERLVMQADAGERVERDLTLLNLGNVAIDVRGAYAFGLFDVGGVDRAVSRTLGGDVTSTGTVDRFIGNLAEEHGGMVRVKVEEGAGSIAPGASALLRVTFAIPPRLRAGHTYWGTWPLDYLRYYVRIHTRRGSAREESST